MTEETDVLEFGLGALPHIPDERDFQISALYETLGIEEVVALPASYAVPGMPAVLNQHTTPQCVAFSSSAMKTWQDAKDQHKTFDFDEATFFHQIGGTANGASVRNAMSRMLHWGYPVAKVGDPQHHKIAAYYLIPRDQFSLKRAILTFGPIIVTTNWYHSWFHPVKGLLP